MGEISDLILEGYLCDLCGGFIDNNNSGYPRTCKECIKENKEEINYENSNTRD